jgi:hypothetical protein
MTSMSRDRVHLQSPQSFKTRFWRLIDPTNCVLTVGWFDCIEAADSAVSQVVFRAEGVVHSLHEAIFPLAATNACCDRVPDESDHRCRRRSGSGSVDRARQRRRRRRRRGRRRPRHDTLRDARELHLRGRLTAMLDNVCGLEPAAPPIPDARCAARAVRAERAAVVLGCGVAILAGPFPVVAVGRELALSGGATGRQHDRD